MIPYEKNVASQVEGKTTVSRVDAIENVDNNAERIDIHSSIDANEQIVQHLQHTGQEVGMTWRTVMAAIVS